MTLAKNVDLPTPNHKGAVPCHNFSIDRKGNIAAGPLLSKRTYVYEYKRRVCTKAMSYAWPLTFFLLGAVFDVVHRSLGRSQQCCY